MRTVPRPTARQKIAGESPSSKFDKAKAPGVKVISKEFE
jgi:NAD-dependent DNA ligase